ncbi:hypothetical protein [Oricola sp.]|uniref:hypothetical protein n=1 Tax=Oricola sp. TaxID=1979950 RepID=UPI003BAAC319
MSENAAVTWLKYASGFIIATGILVAMASHPAASWPARVLADVIFWPVDGAQEIAARETRLLAAIGGGVMAGWGAMMWLTATRVYPKDPQLARLLIAEGALIWFAVDSIGSVAAGAPLNVIGNLGFLALILAPLAQRARISAA